MPADTPGPPGVQYHDERASSGYTLYNSRPRETAALIDMAGNVVHRWSYPQGHSWHYADLTDDGNLGAIVKESEGATEGQFLELDWEGNLVRAFDVPAHHDFERLANGNTMVVCREYVEESVVYAGETKSDYLVELTPAGEPVWEWHAHEHAAELADHLGIEFPRDRRDWAHTNTVELLPETPLGRENDRFRAGNVLTSPRNVDAVCVLDRETGEVVWAWGSDELMGQHMPTMLADGTVLVFDNGRSGADPGESRGYSRVLEVDPRTDSVTWAYVADPPESFYTATRGAAQRLPNGNTLITDSNSGRLFEVTREGEPVWEWLNPDLRRDGERMSIYRATRYPPERIDPLLESDS